MRKFSILVTGHQLKNKVVAKFGDVVDENQLLGNADELVKAGFVKEVKAEKAEAKKETEKPVEEIEVKEPKEIKPTAKK